MSAKTFVDSNVLIYAYDSNAPAKQAKAQAALRVLWTEQIGALSMQVLQEFLCDRNPQNSIPSC
jgi:predicted nucleic acid-binding protein